MRVALVTERLDPLAGGLERWAPRLAEHLLGAGHEVHAVTFGSANHGLPLRLHRLDHHRSPLVRARRIAAAVAGLDAAVVHDTGSGWSADVYHPQTGSHRDALDREIASHGLLRRLKAGVSPRTSLRRWRMARLEATAAARARRIVAVSQRLRRDLSARHGVPLERITVIPNGVDTARWAPDRLAPLRAAAREELGAGEAVLLLGSAHNMRLKGMDNALRALAALRADGADVRLALAGGAPDGFWHGLAGDLGVADRVRFLGSVDDMAPLFAAADALVHPTRWDACSLSTIEAGAAGLPVITTALNGAAELIRDGETGFVLPDPEDVPALTARLRALLDPDARRRMGAAALAASRNHDLRENLRAVEAVLVETALQRVSG